VNSHLHYDYTTVGHITVDVLDDQSSQAGGAAFYSALQAARLGQRTLIITRGVPGQIEALIEPYRAELDLHILPARHTTTLQTSGAGANRRQRLLAWAGPIQQDLAVSTAILHLAPVARESPTRWRGSPPFVGLTPQGLVRQWDSPSKHVVGALPTHAALRVAPHCNALVLSQHEHASCARLIDRASAARAVIAITDGHLPTTIVDPQHAAHRQLAVPAIDAPLDDLGAGDVFAAAFFIALAQRRQPLDAARFASAAAAVRMSGLGAGAIGGLAEIDARVGRG
jgi:hypothetical protein